MHPANTGPDYRDEAGCPARLILCPDCGQMEWWTEEECRDHGRCRASSQPCWCDAEAMQALISLSEAAEYCGLAYSTLAQAIREGRLKGRRAGPKTWLTTRQAIEDAILSHKLRPRH